MRRVTAFSTDPANTVRSKLGLGSRLALCAALASVISVSTPALAQTQAQGVGVSEQARLQRVRVVVNKSDSFRVDTAFTDVLVGSSDIADVLPLSDRMLYILGKKVGTTNVSLYDRNKRLIGVVDVEVSLDTRNVEGKIRGGTGSNDIRVSDIEGKLVLSGNAPDAVSVDRALSVARDLSPKGVVNAVTITSPQQVMLQVRFLEVSRDAGRELGVQWAFFKKGAVAGTIGRTDSDTISFGAIAAQLASSSNAAGAITSFLDARITALESQGLARRLAEPNLTALSGDTATFLAGGEYPYQVVTGIGSSATASVAFKEYGVRLTFSPTVLANGTINLVVAPEVTDLDFTVVVNGTPGLIKRSAKTTIELRDGQSFGMAGLITSRSNRQVEQVPWLGSVPILGTLFRSPAFQEKDSELVLIATARLVRPVAPGKQQLRSPLDDRLPSNDADFFLANRPDVKKNFREYVARGGDVKGPVRPHHRRRTRRARNDPRKLRRSS